MERVKRVKITHDGRTLLELEAFPDGTDIKQFLFSRWGLGRFKVITTEVRTAKVKQRDGKFKNRPLRMPVTDIYVIDEFNSKDFGKAPHNKLNGKGNEMEYEKLQEFLFNNLNQELKNMKTHMENQSKFNELLVQRVDHIVDLLETVEKAEDKAEDKKGGLEDMIKSKIMSDPDLAAKFKSGDMADILKGMMT